MRNLFYIIGLALIAVWAIEWIFFDTTGLVHLLPIIGLVCICIQAARNAPTMPDDYEDRFKL